MKTAVSIPNDIFRRAERLAKRTKRSRSRLFSDALDEYLARHGEDEITAAMNAALNEVRTAPDQFVAVAADRILKETDW